jgi:hypothetical protein
MSFQASEVLRVKAAGVAARVDQHAPTSSAGGAGQHGSHRRGPQLGPIERARVLEARHEAPALATKRPSDVTGLDAGPRAPARTTSGASTCPVRLAWSLPFGARHRRESLPAGAAFCALSRVRSRGARAHSRARSPRGIGANPTRLRKEVPGCCLMAKARQTLRNRGNFTPGAHLRPSPLPQGPRVRPFTRLRENERARRGDTGPAVLSRRRPQPPSATFSSTPSASGTCTAAE